MFGDVVALVFYTVCVGSFFLGLLCVEKHNPIRLGQYERSILPRFSPTVFLLLPLSAALALNLVSIYMLITNNPLLLMLLFAGQGSELKEMVETKDTLGSATTMLMGIVWWAWWRYGQFSFSSLAGRILVPFVLILSSLSLVASAVLKFGRYELMPVIIGLALVFLLHKIVVYKVTFGWLFRRGLLIVIGVIGIFMLFSLARGEIGLSENVATLLGYSLASYNRLSALLNGSMDYPYAGKGVYLFSFVGDSGMLNKLYPFKSLLNFPDFFNVYLSEFSATWSAGLNGKYMWAGTFGYVFAELGWFSPVYVVILGVLYGLVWRAFKMERAFGLVLYPWFAFNILFWVGSNMLLDSRIVALLITALVLGTYEKIFCIQVYSYSINSK